MRALVTGGAGFVGTNLIKRLVKEGHEVTSFDNYSTGFRENQIESEGNDPAESGEAYGTPHSLASLYGAGRYPGSKGVPSGYAVGDKNYPETVLDQGRPAEGPSDYGQQDSNLGKDVTGSQRMKSSNQAEDRPGLNETKKSKKKDDNLSTRAIYAQNENSLKKMFPKSQVNLFEKENLLDEEQIREEIK